MEHPKGKGSGCLRRITRFFLWIIGIMIVLLLTGYLYQRLTTAADFKQYPAMGQRVDVGGYSLHINCTGEGSLTVVVDAGNGDFSLSWQGIQSEVTNLTRICTYDRAGYGWSDPSPKPRTAKIMADELHTLLSKAGVEPPYLLVGHSLGGYNVRMFAELFPDEVVGMVLVDAGHEDQLKRFPPEFEKLEEQMVSYFSGAGLMARFGILRLMGSSTGGMDNAPSYVLKLPTNVQPVYMAMLSHPSYFYTTLDERRLLPETGDQVRATRKLGDLPLIVLTAEITVDPATLEDIGMYGDFDASGIQQVWYELQAEFAALSTQGEQIIVENSTHFVQLDQPQVVIDAIYRVVEMTR